MLFDLAWLLLSLADYIAPGFFIKWIDYQYFTKVERVPENRGRTPPVFGLLFVVL
jgi:hypothetical protein